MNLPEPISISSVDSTQERSIDEDDYEVINDSDRDDSTNGAEFPKNRARVTYSRSQLVDVFKSVSPDYCPDWIVNNENFPRFASEKEQVEQYRIKLIDYDVSELDGWLGRGSWPNPKHTRPTVDKKDGEENGNKMVAQQFKPRVPVDHEPENSNPRLNHRPTFGQENRNGNFNSNGPPNSNGFNPNLKNNMNPRFGERPSMFQNDRRAPNNRMDDRNDGRGFLRSRGENLNQNFASHFRRAPNRNQPNDRLGGGSGHHKQEEPEWFTGGPVSQHDTIELKGFDEDEDRLDASRNSNNNAVPPHAGRHSPQQQPQQAHSNPPPQPTRTNHQQRDEFDLSEFSNFDWQSARANVDKDAIESIENSSRFARWFNEQPPPQSSTSENQLERLFSNVRHPPPNLVNSGLTSSQQLQQQINLQNDFMGNLMGRGNLHQQTGNSLNAVKHQFSNSNLLHNYPPKQPDVEVLFNSPQKKTDQQLRSILQKATNPARIDVDNLLGLGHQREFGKERAPKGHVKSAEELEASLFGNSEASSPAFGQPQPQQHAHTTELLRKLCLNTNQSDANKQLPQTPQPFMREDNSAINPFVLNLLGDAQKLKNTSPVTANRNKPSNYLQNMVFNSGSGQEKVHNPFMPTSVIRKIAAKEKNSQQMNRNMNRNMNEIVNFETVTGNQVNERSILNRLGLSDQQNRAMNHQDHFIANLSQPNVMKQNFAITTADSWNQDQDQHHGNFHVQQHHRNDPAVNYAAAEHPAARAMYNNEDLKSILMKAQMKTDTNVTPDNLPKQNHHPPRAQQNDNQKKLIEILQKASANYGKAPADTGNKINNWFELELKRNNDHLSPIIKENAFTLEDIERS